MGGQLLGFHIFGIVGLVLRVTAIKSTGQHVTFNVPSDIIRAISTDDAKSDLMNGDVDVQHEQSTSSKSPFHPDWTQRNFMPARPRNPRLLRFPFAVPKSKDHAASQLSSKADAKSTQRRLSSDVHASLKKTSLSQTSKLSTSNSTSAVFASIPTPSSTNVTSAASTKAQTQNQEAPVWLFPNQRGKMTAKLSERHVTENMFSQETKAVTTNIALFSGSAVGTSDVIKDKKMTKSWIEEQAARSSPPEIHTAPTIINTSGNTAATRIAKDKRTPSMGPVLWQKISTSVVPTNDSSPTDDIRHIPTREMASLEVTDPSSSNTLASSVMTYAPSETALNPSQKTPRSSRETRSPLSDTHTHPPEAQTSSPEILPRTSLTLTHASPKSMSAPYIDSVTPVSETAIESNAPMTSENLSLSETQTMTSSPTHGTLTMTEEIMTYATQDIATTDRITHPVTDANADQNRITDKTEKKKDITTDGSTDKMAKHSTDKDTAGKKQTTSEDDITSTATNPTENAVMSTASSGTTDCVEAIKVEGLRIVTVGQTTATLTWRYLTSDSRSRVKGVFHVKVKDRKGANACRLYTLEDASDSPSPGLVDKQPRKRESCLQMPEKLLPDNGTVVIRDLKVCTDYDVTMASKCGSPCPCKGRNTSGKASFTTRSSVPGPVESVHAKLNGTDSARMEVTWQPPDYPSCGVQGYVLLLLKDGECVRQIRFQAKGGELKDIDTDERNEGNLCKNSVTVYGSLTSPQIVLSGLSPDTEYTLNITAINDVGMGLPASRPVHTAIIVPSIPTQLRVDKVTSHSVTLKWRPPRPRPGPTTYTVQVMDMGSPYQFPTRTMNTSSKYCATGYEKSSCIVDSLRPYWTYNFTLTAHTARGDSPPASLTALVTTEPSAPGDVENLKVRGAEDRVTEVNVTWDCPALKERNTRITGFLLRSLLQVVKGHMNQTTDVRHVSSRDCDVTHSVDLDVIPERQYFFEVLTLGEKFNATQWTAVSYFVPPGLSEAVTSLSAEAVGAKNVTAWWSKPAVTNGQMTGYGLKVVDSDQSCIRWTLVPLEKTAFGKITNLQPHTIAANCGTQGSGDIVTVAPEDQSVTLTLNHLPPDTSLTLIVYPKNDAGWGQPTNISVHTRETAPTAPTHISVKKTNATTLTVGWKPPQPRPGATNYTVVLHRATKLDSSSLTFLASTSVTVTGWSSTQAVLTDLWSGWRYSLTLTASTSSGSRTVQLSQPIKMPQSPPGQVQNTSAQRVASDYRHVRVTWDYPLLRDRNGIIVNFTVCCQRVVSGRKHCLTVTKACLSSSPPFCATFDVIPGHNYSLKVQANNEYSGVPFWVSYSAKIGPPPALSDVPVTSSVSMGNSQSTFRVTFCAPCLLNDTNGDITFIALLVCREPYCEEVNTTALTSRVFVESLPSWKVAKGENFQSLYRPTDDAWIGAVQTLQAGGARRVAKRSEEEVYTVGEEEECESRDVDVYCNGPVPAGQAFRVVAVACTSVSCSASDFSPSALTDTAAGGPGVVTLSVVGSVLGLAVGLAVVVVLVIGFRRRQGRKWIRGGRGATDDGIEMAAMPVRHRGMTIQDYQDQLQAWKAVTHPESGLPVALVQQFAEIRQMCRQHSQSAAVLHENKSKNRYTNILPYDHSRVKLVAMDDDVTTDYINANYIPGYHSKREYIATQGPLESTVDDFWRMVWEQRCPVIVMLSALTEGRLNKVYKYYPDQDQLHQPVSHGMVTVTLQKVQPQEDFLVRTFRLSVGRGPHHEVQQFFVDSWRDFKANLTPSLVLDFVRAVRREAPGPQKHPLLVHCSAGVGRTGTWIAIDYFMHYIRHSPPSAPLHIRDFVLAMRNCRAHMVQSVEQYVFLHEVVGELVRRKTEVDRYDEPVYSNQPVYANMAYEQDSEEAASNSNGSSSSSSNNPQADTPTSSSNNARPPPPSPAPPSNVLTSRM